MDVKGSSQNHDANKKKSLFLRFANLICTLTIPSDVLVFVNVYTVKLKLRVFVCCQSLTVRIQITPQVSRESSVHHTDKYAPASVLTRAHTTPELYPRV